MGSNTNNTYELKAGANKLEEVNMAFGLMNAAIAALSTAGQNTGVKTVYVPTDGQTDFDSILGISSGASVFVNGAMLIKDVDYIANSYDFVLSVGAELGDDVVLVNSIPLEGNSGASGSFTSSDGKTVTVTSGLITDIS